MPAKIPHRKVNSSGSTSYIFSHKYYLDEKHEIKNANHNLAAKKKCHCLSSGTLRWTELLQFCIGEDYFNLLVHRIDFKSYERLHLVGQKHSGLQVSLECKYFDLDQISKYQVLIMLSELRWGQWSLLSGRPLYFQYFPIFKSNFRGSAQNWAKMRDDANKRKQLI